MACPFTFVLDTLKKINDRSRVKGGVKFVTQAKPTAAISQRATASFLASHSALYYRSSLKNGALITAGFALKQGHGVFGIPGSILSNKSSGVNKLIQEGAKPIMEVNDILEALNLFIVPQQLEMQAVLADNDDERVLLKLISHEPCHIHELIRESGLATTTLSTTPMMMEQQKRAGLPHRWYNS